MVDLAESVTHHSGVPVAGMGFNGLFDMGAASLASAGAPAATLGARGAARGIDLGLADRSRLGLRGYGQIDLRFDLGDRIGSRDWWVGAGLVTTLCALAVAAGLRVTPIPLSARAPLTPAQRFEAAPDRIAPLALGAATGRQVGPTKAVERLAEPPERPRVEVTARVAGGSFEGALRRAGVGPEEADAVARLVGAEVPLARVKPGTTVDLVLGRRETKAVPRPLESLGFRAAFDLRLEVARAEDDSLVLKRVPIAVDDTPLRITGTVGPSLYRSARAAGVPAAIVADYIQAMSYAIDFQRQVGSKDRFDIVVEHRRAETGETETGGLIYAGLEPRKGERIDMLKWNFGGKSQFFRGNGESARKGLMRTPVDGARLTSNFGMRFHPILNYSRMHQGADFGAAYGSPILAAAGGKVTFAGPHGGHGNYIMVTHRKGLATAYAHLSRFAVKPGQQVAQGQVIGYVGSTGISTGPHLHYEVWLDGRPVNPLGIKFIGGTRLTGPDYKAFQAKLAAMRALKGGAAKTTLAAADSAKATRG